jgi:bifunctional ADP-heptose synthase (sugar kinase/adenylyltransferase)
VAGINGQDLSAGAWLSGIHAVNRVINKLKPNIFVKGSEFTEEEIRNNDSLPKFVKVRTYPMKHGYSTTSTLKKIRNISSANKK